MNLVLVAHPDDELLFAGSLMLHNPGIEWLIVCLTKNADRSIFDAVRALRSRGVNARGHSLGRPDEWRILNRAEYEEWQSAVRDIGLDPDMVYTHNRMGEYGHPHHMAVHKIAHTLYPKVASFFCPAESTVGDQFGDWTLGIPPHPDKRACFDLAYPGVWDELTANQPALMQHVAFGAELFT